MAVMGVGREPRGGCNEQVPQVTNFLIAYI